jgi:hypothetical protein
MNLRSVETTGGVRPAAQAGLFYPGEPARLRAAIAGFMAAAGTTVGLAPKAIIAPHAGYVFSGPVAASAFAALASVRGQIRRVVLLGPAHYVAFRGLATSGVSAFATPLGQVPVDGDLTARATAGFRVQDLPAAHRPEHCLEVELPFLQTVLAGFTIMPLLVGEAGDAEVADVLDMLWGGPETLVVVSSDLSHYHDYAAARELDAETAAAIVALEAGRIDGARACGWKPIRGLLQVARRRGLRCHQLDLRNSGDTAGPRDRVVGYGAFAFEA